MSLREECASIFRNGIERIFTNWTALKMALDHGMGPPNRRKLAEDFALHIGDMFLENGGMEPDVVADMLIEFMDTQLHTWCEDDSPTEISNLLCKLFELAKAMNIEELKRIVNGLPVSETDWTGQLRRGRGSQVPADTQSPAPAPETPCVDEEMAVEDEDTDPGWTQVKTRGKDKH